MESLEKEFGNIHVLMSLLIDEIKSLPVVRKGDFKPFERLSYEANAFRDRLREMGFAAESENTYILKELESKLHIDDFHKWLEYMGENLDTRKVENFVRWLEYQTNLRRISNSSTNGNFVNKNPATSYNRTHKVSYMNIAGQMENYEICGDDPHEVTSRPVFIKWTPNDKWKFVKHNRLCFQCLHGDHRRDNCAAPKCKYCGRPHHSMGYDLITKHHYLRTMIVLHDLVM